MNTENSGIQNNNLQNQFFGYIKKLIEIDDVDGENCFTRNQALLIYTIYKNKKVGYDLNCYLHDFGYGNECNLKNVAISILINKKRIKTINFKNLHIENQKRIINYTESLIIQNI